MHTPEGFAELLLLLLIAVAAAAVFLRMRLPAVLGYIVVGIATGPSAFALIQDLETIRSLAELGVVLLLFTIGLEFSLPALARMRGALLGLGGAEVGIATAVTIAIALAIGIAGPGAVLLGGVVAMSSTAMVTKQLQDQAELNEPHGRAALGVLLFQDIAVVPFLVIISGLSAEADGALGRELAMALVKGVVAIGTILLVGRFFLSRVLSTLAELRSGELLTLSALAVALGAAWCTAALGLSPALGAFVAGLMLAESPYRHTMEAEIRPFRDVLVALFFVSVGMLLDLSIFGVGWAWILLLLSALIAFKLVLIVGLCLIARMSAFDSLRTGISLAHGGEFGFALLTVGLSHELLPPDYGQVVLAALLLSMATATLALRFNGAIATAVLPMRSERRAQGAAQSDVDPTDRVLLVGFGRVGQHTARMLTDAGFAWLAIDNDPTRVENARAAGSPVVHGDGTQLEVLRAAGVEQARALALTLDDPSTLLPLVRRVHQALPNLPILVRARDDTHLNELQQVGATEVVPETLEAGLMVGSHLLILLGLDKTDVATRVRTIRNERYRLLRALYPGTGELAPQSLELRAVTAPADARLIGRRLDGLGLERYGVAVTALLRAGDRTAWPSGETPLQANDVLLLEGTPDALDRAEARLVRR